jgi:hypothetical protein
VPYCTPISSITSSGTSPSIASTCPSLRSESLRQVARTARMIPMAVVYSPQWRGMMACSTAPARWLLPVPGPPSRISEAPVFSFASKSSAYPRKTCTARSCAGVVALKLSKVRPMNRGGMAAASSSVLHAVLLGAGRLLRSGLALRGKARILAARARRPHAAVQLADRVAHAGGGVGAVLVALLLPLAQLLARGVQGGLDEFRRMFHLRSLHRRT